MQLFPVGSPWWVQSAWWAAAAVELLSMTGIMWLEPHPAAHHLPKAPSTLRSAYTHIHTANCLLFPLHSQVTWIFSVCRYWTLLRPQLLTALSTTQRSSTPPTVHPPPDHTGDTHRPSHQKTFDKDAASSRVGFGGQFTYSCWVSHCRLMLFSQTLLSYTEHYFKFWSRTQKTPKCEAEFCVKNYAQMCRIVTFDGMVQS